MSDEYLRDEITGAKKKNTMWLLNKKELPKQDMDKLMNCFDEDV